MHKVWEATSGSVNTLEAVERHAMEWIKHEDAKYKKRQKVQKWREIQIKEKEERIRKAEEIRENVQECKDCEKKVKSLEKMKENKQKLAEWKEIKVMKEELQNAGNLVKTVAQIENQILTQPKKLIKRPKSARNMLIRNSSPEEIKNEITPNKKLIEAFQQRDREMLEKKMMEKSKTNPDMIRPTIKIIQVSEESTLLKPTISSLRKGPAQDDTRKYERSFELDTKLLQIDNVPKLGLPNWRMMR